MADQKTEKPTQRKLDKARREGRFAVSREFVGAVQFLAFVWLLGAFGAAWFSTLRQSTRSILQSAFTTQFTPDFLIRSSWDLAKQDVSGPLLVAAVLLAITIASQLFSTGLGISLSKLAPDLKRLNPLTKIKELPRQNLPVLLQTAVLLPVFAAAVYALGTENFETFARLPMAGIESGIHGIVEVLMRLMWRAAALFLFFGFVDLLRQKRRFNKDMRMTKEDIRDESKESEGNPQIKQRVRRLQRDAARRNMMKEVPKATAVIVNPLHFAVAIRYSLESSGAPLVVAKGKNYLALRIKQIAMDHEVPIVENQPLAQALYKSAEVGQEIPADLYRAVAEVLAYIFKIMKGRMPGR